MSPSHCINPVAPTDGPLMTCAPKRPLPAVDAKQVQPS